MPRSWKSSDYICPACKNWNLGKNMFCATCNHPKPTLNTMGERAHDFYPLASQKMYCQGQKNCPECHAIVHISHSECMACRDRKQNAMNINTHQACVVTTATGSKDAMRSASVHAIMAPEKLAIKAPRPKTAVDALEDKYRGVDPLAIIDDLERVKSGGDGLPTMDEIEEKKRIAEEEEKEKEREKERERQRQEQAEQTKKDLALAKEQAVQMEQERKRKREAAQDLIAAMLDAEDAAAPPAASAATAASAEVPAPALEAEERRQKLLQQAEELRKKQEEMKQRQQAEDDAQRQRMRERRQRRAGAAEAATEAATEVIAATVVLD